MIKKLSIIHTPNTTLRQGTREISREEIGNDKIQRLIAGMKKTLAATPDGVGLAAPQVGEPLRIFIVSEEAEEIDRWEEKKRKEKKEDTEETYEKRKWNYYVFINPVIKKNAKKKLMRDEGCLSVPGKFGPVPRAEKITLEAFDEQGKKFVRGATRFFARVLQHELDHLEGILFIDKVEKLFDVPKKHE